MCPDDGARPAGWRASLELELERRGARTVLAARRHDGPLVVQKPLYPEGGDVCHAIVVHPPAGIAGGDALALSLRAGPRASVLLTTPGAAKWYRSSGLDASQRTHLKAEPGATLEWLPQENIVFDGARAHVEWRADLAADARMVAWDLYCLGRTGSGERFERGECRIETRIVRDGRLAWIERARLVPAGGAMGSAAGLCGMPVFGTMAIAAPAIDDAWLAAARAIVCANGETGVTRLPGLLLARYRGASGEAARRYFTAIWTSLREPVLGRAAVAPRIWST
jgi:urease accessory protein